MEEEETLPFLQQVVMVSLTLPLPQGLLKNVAVVPPFHQRYSPIEFLFKQTLYKKLMSTKALTPWPMPVDFVFASLEH